MNAQRGPDGEPERHERGRLLPGSQPGWGASWWFAEQGHADIAAMTPERRVELLCSYFEAVAAGWKPPVPREQWVGPHDPVAAREQAKAFILGHSAGLSAQQSDEMLDACEADWAREPYSVPPSAPLIREDRDRR